MRDLPDGGGDGQAAYLEYVVPGVIAITIGGGCGGAAIAIAMDMHEGIIARFRTMAISRGAVLFGHVLGNTIQVLIAVVLVFGGVAGDRVPPDHRPAASGSPRSA